MKGFETDEGRPIALNHQTLITRFIKACESNNGIAAAFLVGSYVKGKPDEHSDLDLYLVINDESFDDFASERETFVHLLGEPIFMEDFGLPGIVFLIFPDGSEVELSYSRESQVNLVSNEPFKVLLDKKNISASVGREKHNMDQTEQTEKLRRLIYWFWHEMSHLITALGRGQLWWAQGQLESIRSMCVGLARLQNNFLDADVTGEVYFKIEKEITKDRLSPLQDTFPPMEKDAILKAGFTLVKFYKKHAKSLAQEHGIAYPERLEKIMVERLKKSRSEGVYMPSKDIDKYISSFPKEVQAILKKVRATIRKAAPDAEEKINYGIPTFLLNGNLVHYAAFKSHIGFYPTPSGIEKFKRELSTYEGAKGSVKFPLGESIPYGLITKIVKFRVKENLERAEAKRKKK